MHKESENITTNDILKALSAAGFRNTRPRRVIAEKLAALASANTDFNTEQFYKDLLQEDPHIGRATVFRTVEDLVNVGLLDRISFADGTHRYRVCGSSATHHHHHLTCSKCHQVVEIEACLPEQQLADIASRAHFKLQGHSLDLFGICENCTN